MDYYIRNAKALEKLRKEKQLKKTISKIKIDFSNNAYLKKLEKRLNKYYFACGCTEGATAVYLLLICCFIIWCISGFTVNINWWKIVVAIFIAGLIGKLYGIISSRYRLKKIFYNLENYIINNSIS